MKKFGIDAYLYCKDGYPSLVVTNKEIFHSAHGEFEEILLVITEDNIKEWNEMLQRATEDEETSE